VGVMCGDVDGVVWRRSVWEWTAGRRGERAAVASSERAYLVRLCLLCCDY
jgi:hypothetical protein